MSRDLHKESRDEALHVWVNEEEEEEETGIFLSILVDPKKNHSGIRLEAAEECSFYIKTEMKEKRLPEVVASIALEKKIETDVSIL